MQYAIMRAIRPTSGPHFEVRAPMLDGIACSGSGEIRADSLDIEDMTVKTSGSGEVAVDELVARDVEIGVSGSGDVRVDRLQAEALEGILSGSGGARLEGRVDRQRIRVSGSGTFDGDRLETRAADVGVSGSGDARVWVTDSLDASTSGSGGVWYHGEPEVTQHQRGSGKLHEMGHR